MKSPTIEQVIAWSGQLPAAEIAVTINQSLQNHDAIVITAPPGAGKSTLLPLTIMTSIAPCKKILMLEPRRLAAKQIARRMASTLNEPVGESVGYRVRFESCISKSTRIEVLTEGILTRMLIDDATLNDVGVVIFDEFHERSINTDLALALTRQVQQLIRPDMKIIIMSATIDASEICNSLNAPLIESKGRMYPVQIINDTKNICINNVAMEVASAVVRMHDTNNGNILAFLPGQAYIIKCEKILNKALPNTLVCALYGNLSPQLQQKAIAPLANNIRKIVLATPIAETSLTIEGISIVVDSGLHRKLQYNTRTGLSHLVTTHISLDMATQRAGRAGRLTNGICYRLWTKAFEHQMKEKRSPEIEDTDLSATMLSIQAFGEPNINTLPWLTPPNRENVLAAQLLLQSLNATDQNNVITALGKKMSALPCHPRIARMMFCSGDAKTKSIACDIASIIEEKDLLAEGTDTDITLRINTLRSRRLNARLERWTRIAQIAREYHRMLHISECNDSVDTNEVGTIIACAYPERVAMAIDHIGNYRMANGNYVQLDRTDPQSAYPWIAIASLHSKDINHGRVFLTAPLDINKLDNNLTKYSEIITWDSSKGCIVAQQEMRIGKLVISSKPLNNPCRQAIIDAICEAAKKEALSMFNWTGESQQLQRRVQLVSMWHSDICMPDISTETLINSVNEWLPFYLKQDGKLRTTITQLKDINIHDVMWALLPYESQQLVDTLAPTHIRVPSGSNLRIDYRNGTDIPVLSVRLQECFGMKDTPRINNGRQPLLMELLSPGFKPVQLTQDLGNFWKNTYFEVRKELKRRYPKHYWPENPLEAEPTRKTKRTK